MTWTWARDTTTGNEAILPVDALPQLPAWEPVGEPAETQQELQVRAELDRRQAASEAATRAALAAAATDGTIAEVREAVDGDPTAAAAALAAEQEKDQPRPTLVDELEHIAEPADPATTEGT